MSIPHIEAERTRVNLVKHYRPIGPAAIVAAVAAKNSKFNAAPARRRKSAGPASFAVVRKPSVKTKIS